MECNFKNCGYYTDGECNICGMGISGEDTFCRLCKDNQNCYYKQLAGLKAENAKLKSCLQEINAIAEQLLEKGLEPQSVEHQLRLKGKRELASIISDLITKAEEE